MAYHYDMSIPNKRESWTEHAIHDLLGGITKAVVATGVSSTTIWRAVRAGKINDSELLFTVATLTGVSPWLLAGRDQPQRDDGAKRRASRRRAPVVPIDWKHNSRGQSQPTARLRLVGAQAANAR